MVAGHPVEAHGEERRAPTSVASARAGTDTGAVDHDEVKVGFALEEVVGGPESGEPGADDDGVASDRPVERDAVDAEVIGQGVVPQ